MQLMAEWGGFDLLQFTNTTWAHAQQSAAQRITCSDRRTGRWELSAWRFHSAYLHFFGAWAIIFEASSWVGAYNLTPGCSYGVQPSSPEPRGRRYQRQETPQIQQTKRKYRERRRVLCRYRLPHTWWLTWFTFLGPYIVFFNKNPIHFPWR